MFQLTCPSCRDQRTSPFVRITAVTRCPACGHVWRISESHVKKTVDAGPPPPPPKPEPALTQDAPASDDPKGGSSVTGLSGLSDLMQAEAMPLAATRGEAPPVREAKLAAPKSPTKPGKSRIEVIQPAATSGRDPATPRSRRTAVLIVAVLAMIVALAGIALSMMSSPGTPGTPENSEAPASGSPKDSGGGEPLDADDVLPQGPPPPEEADTSSRSPSAVPFAATSAGGVSDAAG